MRFLEILLFSMLAASVFSLLQRHAQRNQWLHLLPALSLLLALLQLLAGGYRWQLMPLYLLTVILLLAAFKPIKRLPEERKGSAEFRETPPKRPATEGLGLRIAATTGSLLLLLLAGLADHIFPMAKLPAPAGAYAIGTTSLYLKDTSREELLTADPEDSRELVVNVWYPAADKGEGRRSSYIAPEIARAYALQNGFPGFVISHLQKIKTHSYQEAPLATDEPAYPVLIFCHGLRVPITFYTSIIEHLASQGYIIFGISHTYETAGVVFPDNRLATYNTQRLDTLFDWDRILQLDKEFRNNRDYDSRTRLVYQLNEIVPDVHRARDWSKDVSFVIDELIRIHGQEPQHPFYGRLNLEKLGMVGHSYGGVTVGQAMVSDSRIKAGVNMDGVQFGDILHQGLQRPLLGLTASREEGSASHIVLAPQVYRMANINPLHFLEVIGTDHSNFGDIPFLVNTRLLNGAGPVDPYACIRTVNILTHSFFEQYLQGKGNFSAGLDKLSFVKKVELPGR